MHNGYVKIWRPIMLNDSLDTALKKLVFIASILRANHKPAIVKGIKIKRGEFCTSYQKFTDYCGGKRSTIIDALKEIESDNMIRIKNHGKCVVIQVVKYDDYQNSEQKPHDNRTITVTKPSENRQKTVKKPVTNKKKEERIKNKECREQQKTTTNYFPDNDLNEWVGHVSPTMLKKWERFDPLDLQEIAEEAKLYQEQSGKKYSSIALYLNNWFKRDKKYKQLEEDYNFNAIFEKYDKQF